MKLQRSTVALVGAALILAAAVLVLESQAPRRQAADSPDTSVEQAGRPDAAARSLFDFAETDVVALQVQRSQETLAFKRDEAGNWQMVSPQAAEAEAAAIAFLLSRLTSDAPLREITLAADQQQTYGFDPPAATVELTLQDGKTHTLVLGGRDFSGSSLYALVDPAALPLAADAEPVPLYIVSPDVASAVERPLPEWTLAPVTPESESSSADSEPNSTDSEAQTETEQTNPAPTE